MPFPLRTSILGPNHQDANELGLGQTWAEDYIEHSMESVKNQSTADYPSAVENENPNIAYSKFMKFMHQEGELPVESRESSSAQLTDSKWTENFMEQEPQAEAKTAEVVKTPEASKNDEATTSSAETWANQFTDNQYKKGKYKTY